MRRQLEQIKALQKRIKAECIYLQEEIKSDHNFEDIIGGSDALGYVLYRAGEVAPTNAPVLITGETGTGKELIARAIHHAGPRAKRPLVKVNCAVLPAILIESELFGHVKGAFTGADAQRIGRFQLADGATLFLDEISEIPLELQAKLLRVLQDGEMEPLGSSKTIRVDVRIIAASNRCQMDVLAGKKKEFLQAVPEILGNASRQPGCIRHFMCRDLEDDHRFFTIQAWEDQMQLDAHWRSDRCGTFLGTFHLLKSAPVMQIHAVAFTAGMEAVKAARAKPPPPQPTPIQNPESG